MTTIKSKHSKFYILVPLVVFGILILITGLTVGDYLGQHLEHDFLITCIQLIISIFIFKKLLLYYNQNYSNK